MFSKQCQSHLNEVNETAIDHMYNAVTIAVKLQALVPLLLVHSVVPSLFTTTASDTMKDILKDRGTTDE
tara:strand:+ start:7175 stop:7381 length:207 start_codon:yes stop_codon:yes gene_type:complete